MGYDKGECIICYCKSHYNNGGDSHNNICSNCFFKQCPEGLSGRACHVDYVRVVNDIKCDFCNKIDICLYQVDMCSDCLKELNPNGKKLICQLTVEDEDNCNCPYCPRSNGEFHSLFIK